MRRFVVKRVVRETADAVSLVFDVPSLVGGSGSSYQRRPVPHPRASTVGGEEHRRCYSMSSSPHRGEPADHRQTGPGRRGVELVERQCQPRRRDPRGATGGPVRLRESGREVVAFAGGSGITPVFSLIQSALAGSVAQGQGVLCQPRPGLGDLRRGACPARLAVDHPDRLIGRSIIWTRTAVSWCRPGSSLSWPPGMPPLQTRTTTSAGPHRSWTPSRRRCSASGVTGDRVHLERFSVAPTAVPT